MNYTQLASDQAIEKTIASLKENGIDAFVVQTGQEAKQKVVTLIPQGAEVMNMTSVTLDSTGISQEIMESGKFNSVRTQFAQLNSQTQKLEMNRLGSAPEWAVGSVHAVTEDGKVLIASNTGSQIPAYVYGALHVIWVVGIQKIVANLDEGMKRVYEHTLPLESQRAQKAYGVEGSAVNKLLIINKETQPERITIIFVKEQLGF